MQDSVFCKACCMGGLERGINCCLLLPSISKSEAA